MSIESNYTTIIAVVHNDNVQGMLDVLHHSPDVLSSFSEPGLQVAVNAGFSPEDYLDEEELEEEDFAVPFDAKRAEEAERQAKSHWNTPERVIALFQPQYWDSRDYAVDAGPSVVFDVTDQLKEMTLEEIKSIEDSDDGSDDLYHEAVRQGLIAEHDGPFYVHVQTQIEDYLEALAQESNTETDEGSQQD